MLELLQDPIPKVRAPCAMGCRASRGIVQWGVVHHVALCNGVSFITWHCAMGCRASRGIVQWGVVHHVALCNGVSCITWHCAMGGRASRGIVQWGVVHHVALCQVRARGLYVLETFTESMPYETMDRYLPTLIRELGKFMQYQDVKVSNLAAATV